MNTKYFAPTLVALTALSGLGCGRVASVSAASTQVLTLQPSTLSLQTDQSAPLTAIATSDGGNSQDLTTAVTWQTSSPAIMITKGNTTCTKPGTYTVTATTVSLQASASITCVAIASLKTVKALQFVSPPLAVMSTAPSLLKVQAVYLDGSTSDVTSSVSWATDGIAHVSANGVVYCDAAGTANISATLNSSVVNLPLNCFMKHIRSHVGFVEQDARFYGPFASWLNVKAVFGAKGDGVSDDTAALRLAITTASQQGKVLFFPHGTYIVTDTLHVVSTDGMVIVGEDPGTTSIKWMGTPGGTMVSFDGSTRFRMARIALDGNNHRAGVDVYIGSTFKDGQFYPTFDALEDLQIHHADVGILMGFAGETTVNRVHFDENNTGVLLDNFNALNFNIIDSLFTDNKTGVSNDPGSGTFNVSHSVFVRSTYADMLFGNTGSFSIRQNISSDSQAFLVVRKSGAPAAVTLQENIIRGVKSAAVQYGNPGVLMLIDNTLEAPVDPQQAMVYSESFQPTKIFSIGNVFSSSHPFQGSIGTIQSIDEQPQAEIPVSSIQVPSGVYVPPVSTKPVVDIAEGTGGTTIQQVINDAALVQGGAIIHFSAGQAYKAYVTIDVPDAPELALVGDGPRSALVDAGIVQGGPVVRTHGSIEIDGLYIGASRTGLGLQALVDDQPSTRIFCDVCTTLDSAVGVSVSGLDNVKLNTMATTVNGLKGFMVSGGLNQAGGRTTLGSMNAFMTTSDTYGVNNWGRFLISDGFHDGGQQPLQAAINGAGVVTQEGGVINANGMTLKGFSGIMSFLGVQVNTWLTADKTSSGVVGLIGTVNLNTSFDVAGTSATLKQASGYGFDSTGLVSLPMSSANTRDIEHLFAQGRTEDVLPRERAIVGANTVRIHRVMVQFGTGMSFGPRLGVKSSASYTIKDLTQGSGTSAGCSVGSVSLSGTWTLDAGNDGFYGLKGGGSYLENMIPSSGGLGVLTLASQMTDAGQRWLIEPSGDGTFTVVNRADGSVLSRASSGCGVMATPDGSSSQKWVVAAATI